MHAHECCKCHHHPLTFIITIHSCLKDLDLFSFDLYDALNEDGMSEFNQQKVIGTILTGEIYHQIAIKRSENMAKNYRIHW